MTAEAMTDQQMAAEETAARDHGPIDYLAVEFPEARMGGEGLAAPVALGDRRSITSRPHLVDPALIRLLDPRAVPRESDGTFTAVAITDLDNDGTLDLAIFEGVESGLLDDEDLQKAADLIEPGKVVALIVYENTWAIPFVNAMRRVGAELIASGRIPADEVIAALDSLEAEE